MTGYRLFLPLSCLIIVLLINLITTPTFFKITINNGVLYGYIIDVINRASELVVLAVGMTLVVSASAGTDISVGAVMAVSAAVCTRVLAGGEVSVNEYANPHIPAVLAALAVAVVCGGFNGFLVAKLKIQPMVATLILFTAGRGISQLVTNGQITYIRVDGYKLLGNNIPGIPIPTPIFVAVIVVALTYILLNKTAMGMYIQSVGINERASRLVGLKSVKIIWMAYAFCGLCAGIAGLVASSRYLFRGCQQHRPQHGAGRYRGSGFRRQLLGGGRFSLLGSVIGAYTIQALTTTLYAMSVPADQIPVYKAIVVILIVAVQSEELKKFRKRLASRHASGNVEGGVA
ncbi:MAG: ABC transporter permease [Enterocloster clostridioformis]